MDAAGRSEEFRSGILLLTSELRANCGRLRPVRHAGDLTALARDALTLAESLSTSGLEPLGRCGPLVERMAAASRVLDEQAPVAARQTLDALQRALGLVEQMLDHVFEESQDDTARLAELLARLDGALPLEWAAPPPLSVEGAAPAIAPPPDVPHAPEPEPVPVPPEDIEVRPAIAEAPPQAPGFPLEVVPAPLEVGEVPEIEPAAEPGFEIAAEVVPEIAPAAPAQVAPEAELVAEPQAEPVSEAGSETVEEHYEPEPEPERQVELESEPEIGPEPEAQFVPEEEIELPAEPSPADFVEEEAPVDEAAEYQRQLAEAFAEESEEVFVRCRDILAGGAAALAEPQPLYELFRAFHTLKGASAAVGLDDLSAEFRKGEKLLEAFWEEAKDGTLEVPRERLHDFLRALLASFRGLTDRARGLPGSDCEILPDLDAAVAELRRGETPAPTTEPHTDDAGDSGSVIAASPTTVVVTVTSGRRRQ